MTNKKLKDRFIEFLFLTIGPIIAAFALDIFLVPNNIIDGGIVGISIITEYLTKGNLGLIIFLLNLPFFFLAFNKIGKHFVFRTFYAILMLSLGVNFFHINHFSLTNDLLLVTVFGGIILGAGVGLVLKNNGAMDGTEILSLVLSKKIGVTVGECIMFFNVFIYTAAGFIFGFEKALYSVLTYFIAYKVIDIVVEGFNTSKSVRIISNKYEEIGRTLISELEIGVTYIKAKGGYSGDDKTIIYCVMSRLELAKLKEITAEIDPSAFISIVDVHESFGGSFKKYRDKI
ncbi:YitT family protein [bacterium]|nr:YitT family protein [bacterium]